MDEARVLLSGFAAALRPHLRPQPLEEMRARREEGFRIVLASTVMAPLLEQVGTPVAVVPDAKLRAVAGERKWRIIDPA